MTWPSDIQSSTPAKYLFKLVSETDSVVCNPEPLEWKSGTLEMKRDIDSGGVISTFQSDSLTFVGNGAEFLRKLFEAYEVNAKCTLIIYWWKFTTRAYVEFPSRFDINFNFYEKVKVGRFFFGIRVKAINTSMQTKLDNRQDVDVNLKKLTSIGSTTENIKDYTYLPKTLHYNETNVAYSGRLVKNEAMDPSVKWALDHKSEIDSYTAIPFDLSSSDFSERLTGVSYITKCVSLTSVGSFFKAGDLDYDLDITYYFNCLVTNRYVGEFPWVIQILETHYNGNMANSTEIINTYEIGGFGGENRRYFFDGTVQVHVSAGNELKAVVFVKTYGGTKAYIQVQEIRISQQVSQSPATDTEGFPIYEAIERTSQLILDQQYPVYSDFFGRQDISFREGVKYATESQLRFAHIQGGMNLRGVLLTNEDSSLALNFKKLFQTLKALWNVGYSLESNPALFGDEKQRIRIEEYQYFFQDTEIVFTPAIKDRITKYDIQSQVMPELIPVDLKAGFDSFEYLTLNGRAESNTTNQRTSIMNTPTKWENISPFRGDTKGIYDNLANPVGTEGTTDTKGDSSVFIVKTQKGTVSDWKPEAGENITIENDSSLFREDLLNRYFTPSRMMVRHGNRITAGMTLFPGSSLKFQKSEKSNTLETTGTAQSGDDQYTIKESDDILVSELASPIYKAIKHTAVIPGWTFSDLEQLQAHPYGYIQFSDSISGYILSFKKKNNEDKAEITIIERYVP
jgi:hypothetical protein